MFTGVQARAIGRGFGRFAKHTGLVVWAASILTGHAHLVVAPHRYTVDQIANLMKGEATRALIAENVHPLADYRTRTARFPKAWARGSWKVFLDTDRDLRRAIRYVEENPIREGKPRQHWSFVSALDA